MRIANLRDGADFRFSFGRSVINSDQDCISRASLVWLFGEVAGKVEANFTAADIL